MGAGQICDRRLEIGRCERVVSSADARLRAASWSRLAPAFLHDVQCLPPCGVVSSRRHSYCGVERGAGAVAEAEGALSLAATRLE